MLPRDLAVGAIALLLVPGVAAAQVRRVQSWKEPTQPAIPLAPYFVLDETPETHTNFNFEAVRPMVVTPDGIDYYALNTHAGTVAHYIDGSGLPVDVWHVGVGPVAIALIQNDLFVVCQGSDALFQLDRATGQVVDCIQLPPEPSDIVYDDSTGQAFVACTSADSIAQVDVATMTVTEHALDVKRPRFLSLDDDGRVLIAPMNSGNNSTVIGGGGNSIIIDLDDVGIAPNGGLPDADLLALDPATGIVTTLLRGMGSLLLAHGRNPVTDEYWMLNIQSLNKDPATQTEPAVNGQFALNALSIADTSGPGVGTADRIIDLDDWDPSTAGEQYDANRSISFPHALVFTSTGFALVAGSQSDRVTLLDTTGARVLDYIVPDGGIPQGMIVDPTTETLLLVWSLGTNKIYVYSLVTFDPNPVLTLDLGLDPTPPAIRAGRELFYDASFSSFNRFTCQHCHPAGEADNLAWNIGDLPRDDKGPMVTQILKGLENLFPYHWRGERALIEFNGAFPGLLGGTKMDETPGGQFDLFQEFVFSMRPRSNPFANRDRLVHREVDSPAEPNGFIGEPVNGQHIFLNVPTDGAGACIACHSSPTGGGGDIVAELPSLLPERVSFEVTAFSNGTIPAKEQKIVQVDMFGGTFPVPTLGFGFLHPGVRNSLFDFNDFFFGLVDQDLADLTSFVRMWDQGLSRGAQTVFFLDQQSDAGVARDIRTVLLAQAQKGWVGVVVFGEYPIGGSPTELRWYYDPSTNLFQSEDGNLSPVGLDQFQQLAGLGLASNVFMGVAPGNEIRLSVDLDEDGLLNGDEFVQGTDEFIADFDGDTWPDGYEVAHGSSPTNAASVPSDTVAPRFTQLPQLVWMSTTSAKLTFRTDEPTQYTVDFMTRAESLRTQSGTDPSTVHTVILQDLLQSTEGVVEHLYSGTVTIQDLSGNPAVASLPRGMKTESMIFIPEPGPFVHVVSDAEFTSETRILDVLIATARMRADRKMGGPPGIPTPNRVFICNLIVDGQIYSSFTSSRPTTFDVDGTPYAAKPGPFIMSGVSTVTGNPATDGYAEMDFLASGLTAGQEISLNIVAVVEVDPLTYDEQAPDIPGAALFLWSKPDTKKDLRQLNTTF